MIVKTIIGNLLEEYEKRNIDVMVHGCNCFHTMGAGIAGQIAGKYPEVFEADKTTKFGDFKKLGTYTGHQYEFKKGKMILNLYTQFKPGANFEYTALIKVLKTLNRDFKNKGLIFGFPEIGCGIGGGDWYFVEKLIQRYTTNLKIIVVKYDHGIKNVGTTRARFESEIQGLE